MTLQLGIYASATGIQLLDATYRASGLSFSSGEHGDEQLSAFIRLPLADAFRLYDHPGLLHVALHEYGSVVWEGRLENVSIQRGGIQIAALGYWRALSDVPYSALWSTTKTSEWRTLTSDDVPAARPERYVMDTTERLFVTLKKGAIYGNLSHVAYFALFPSDNNPKPVVGISFDYAVTLPTNWQLLCQTHTRSFSGVTTQTTIAGTGAAVTGSLNLAFAGDEVIRFTVRNNTGGNYTNTQEDGDWFVNITNVRVVTSNVYRINTTLTTNRNAGASVTATVGSTARMYAGQRIQIGGTVSESVLVESVTNSTQFVATFLQNHVTTNTVQAHVIYADRIALGLATHINSINSAQLSESAALVSLPGIDLLDESYHDELPSDILARLAALGDNSATPVKYETGVSRDRVLFFRAVGAGARTWYVDITELQLERTIDALYNSAYATYQNESNITARSPINADTNSVLRYGLTRRAVVETKTTSATQAGVQRDMVLADRKNPPPKAQIQFSAVYDAGGGRYPLTTPRAGDTFVMRNLPVGVVSSIDRIRSFRVSRCEYDADNNTLTIEPETPPDTLEFALARKEKGL